MKFASHKLIALHKIACSFTCDRNSNSALIDIGLPQQSDVTLVAQLIFCLVSFSINNISGKNSQKTL